MPPVAIPEQGQLVEVRRRQYVVTGVSQSALPLGLPGAGPQHLVSLASIEDDVLGEELRVIWELEPGAAIREHLQPLPQPRRTQPRRRPPARAARRNGQSRRPRLRLGRPRPRPRLPLLYDDLADELGVLFDRELPQSLLFPSETCLRAVLEILNHPELADIWVEDETIGWVYQFFTPKQMRDQARKESAAPRNSHELAFRNQFFTPRYVVEFLVDNTLGRLWWEMRQGDTALVDRCRYLLRPPDEPVRAREKRDPRTLRVLDPAVGSGHFLLYGFDLFEVIYAEAYEDPELGPALQQDYADRSAFDRAVPELIFRHNLHGIDIDLRPTQIAALALWLRAQRSYQAAGLKVAHRPGIRRVNVITVEPMPGNAALTQEFLDNLDNPAVRELVETLWQEMQAADEIGSLLKIEQRLAEAAAQAKKDWSNLATLVQGKLFTPSEPTPRQLNFEYSFIEDESFWQRVEEHALAELRRLASSAANGHPYGRRLFADDAERGLAFIDMMRQPFDCI